MNRCARARRRGPLVSVPAAEALCAAALCALLAAFLGCSPRYGAHGQSATPAAREAAAETSGAKGQAQAAKQPPDTARAPGAASAEAAAEEGPPAPARVSAPPRPRESEPPRERERSAGADTTLYKVSAGTMHSTVEQNERVLYLEGGVRIEHETTTITSLRGKDFLERHFVVLYDSVRVVDGSAVMTSDQGTYNGETSMLVLDGRVHMTDRGWRASCDRVRYNRARRIAVMTGHLSLEDSTRVMHADTVFYYRDRDVADAVGHFQMIDTTEDYEIEGDRAHYDRLSHEAIVDESPVLIFNLKSAEKGTVTSRLMRFDVDRRVGIATTDVRMTKGDTWATCDSAVIYDKEQRAELYGSPKASNGTSSMTGPRMVLYYNEKEITRVVLPDHGDLEEMPPKGSPWRQNSTIEGDSVVIYLSAEKVDSVQIVGGARAMYYPVEGEKGKVSNDYSTGDRMFFVFKNNDLSYVRISGRSTGLYKYITLAPRETIDSLAAAVDTSLQYRSFVKGNERVVYGGDVIEYFADRQNIRLIGNATLRYKDSSLSAKRIDFSSKLDLLEATGNPILEETGQKMYGDDMGYDMDTEAGVILNGQTKYGEGYYEGRDLFKVGRDILKVYGSTYTTCDLIVPHYCLRANKMKVYVDNKIVSGPIFLYIGEMPVFYLPFFVNNIKRERSSGFLRPNFDVGINSREGRFIRGLGYFWATNDYTDFLMQADFNEHSNVRVHLGNEYNVRYLLSGNVLFDYVRTFGTRSNQWTIESNHTQTISRTASFRSQLRFVSSDQAQQAVNYAENIQRYIDRRIFSSAAFSKSWGGTRLNLSGERNQTLNVVDSSATRLSTTLPSVSLNFPQTSLWLGHKHPRGEQSIWERALGSVLFSPNISATRQTTESAIRSQQTLTASSGASFGQQRSLAFISYAPAVGLSWSYFKELSDKISPDFHGIVTPHPADRNEVSMSLAVNNVGMKLYGTFEPHIGPLVAIRHTINPTVSYSYTPKLSERQKSSQFVSYSLHNSFDAKLMRNGREVKQNGFLTWDLSGSYDPDLPRKLAWSNVGSSTRLQLGVLAFNLNNTYSIQQHKIISTAFSTGFSFRGSIVYPAAWTAPTRARIRAASETEVPKTKQAEQASQGPQAPVNKTGNWSLNLNYNFTETGLGVFRTSNSNVDISASLLPSSGWTITYSAYYDIERQTFTSQTYTLERDLHCWHAGFTHRRFGNDWAYYFQIQIKAHPEIMYERGTRGLQSFGGTSYLTGGY
jgi:lipopolysaccharide assembly outer membrane protein LptD (OstA)